MCIRDSLHQDKELGGEILRGEGLGDGAHFRDISFTVHAGEVLGVTGLLGDGRSELFQAVFGDLPYTCLLYTSQFFFVMHSDLPNILYIEKLIYI